MPKIVCVVPTIRPERMETFRAAWKSLFKKHDVTLITVFDGDQLRTTLHPHIALDDLKPAVVDVSDLLCRYTDACRNLGFITAAQLKADYILTLDDDVVPLATNSVRGSDPIQDHLDALAKRVPIYWMSTAHDTDLYPRGMPYSVRAEAPVMLSHGVWVGVPDFDGETQLRLEETGTRVMKGDTGIPYSLPYYVGPIPHAVNFPLCGMNVMVKREALPNFYFAPMGPDSGFPNLHRFADIFMGIMLKREFDIRGWACYTGASTVLHTRASDAKKNCEQEKLGRAWLDAAASHDDDVPSDAQRYFESYYDKRVRYAELIKKLLEAT